MRDVFIGLLMLIWSLTCLIGSIWLYGWQGWSGWWVVFGIVLAASVRDAKYTKCANCGKDRLGD